MKCQSAQGSYLFTIVCLLFCLQLFVYIICFHFQANDPRSNKNYHHSEAINAATRDKLNPNSHHPNSHPPPPGSYLFTIVCLLFCLQLFVYFFCLQLFVYIICLHFLPDLWIGHDQLELKDISDENGSAICDETGETTLTRSTPDYR